MTSRTAIVAVFLVVAILAFSFASVFSAMTGTYHLNFGDDNNKTPFFGNSSQHDSNSYSSSNGHVETYSDSGSSSSHVETTEDTTPTPTPSDDPHGGGGGSNATQ